jgi:diguanylate cyclase (GGDEF)-like protein
VAALVDTLISNVQRAADPATTPHLSSLPPQPDTPRRVLVLDEDPRTQTLVANAVQSDGHRVQGAATTAQFWEMLREFAPDVVIVGAELRDPPVNEICGDLRMNRETRHTPIVIVSIRHIDEDLAVRSLRAGADDCASITRPRELRARLAVQLRHKRYHDMLQMLRSERDVLKVAATVDPLTGIPNRRTIEAAIHDAMARASKFCLLFLDIDHFKSINDELGHDAGDEVLRAIGGYLQRGIRGADMCGRLGGEEFVILVDGVDAEVGERVAERHRFALEKLHVAVPTLPRPVTVSIGVAAYDPAAPDPRMEDLLKRADGSLYEAKRSGRNRVCVAAPLAPAAAVEKLVVDNVPSNHPLSSRRSGRAPDDIETALVRQLDRSRASLPVLPQVAATALRLANDPDANMVRFAELVERDPHVAARFLSLANSVLYSRGFRTTTTRDAVVRVGLAGARDILFQIVYSASTIGLPRFQQSVAASYRRGVLGGLAARIICRVLGRSFAFDYLCGLLHDIGEARVYRALANIDLPCNERKAADLVAQHHATAGSELASFWGLPEDIVLACAFHHAENPDDRFAVRLVQMADAFLDYANPSTMPGARTGTKDWFFKFDLTPGQADAIQRQFSATRKEISSRGW